MKKLLQKVRNRKILQILIAIATVLVVLGVFFFFEKRRDRVFIDTSLISAPIIGISPDSAGKLFETDVYENQTVSKGDVLATVGDQTLYADTDGLIIMANNQIGSIVSTQTPVAQMIDPTQMRVAATLDENKGLNDIHVGQVASFTVDALPGKTFWGYVDKVSPSAKQTQLAFSISSERPTQQFVVYISFNSTTYPEIKNGMSAKVTVFTSTY